jgi:hypothetical protein
MKGVRLLDGEIEANPFQPGAYGRIQIGADNIRWIWACTTPNNHFGRLDGHDVVEHDDGTITVSPSILISNENEELWHGYLEHGIWRSV